MSAETGSVTTGSVETARRSPLHDVHLARGAVMAPFAGWSMPLRYTSETAEHLGVRSGAGVFDVSHMSQLEVAGPGATALLDLALVADVTALRTGRAKYTVMCGADGGIVDDLIVYRLAADRLLVIANAANAAPVADGLAAAAATVRSTGDQVTVTEPRRALLAVQGPAAADIVAALAADPGAVHGLRGYGCVEAVIAGAPTFLARTGYTGEDGFELSLPPAAAVEVWQAIERIGAGQGLVLAGLAARDSLRVEAGMALYGHELSRQITLGQAGLARLVPAGKAVPYVGNEALARLDAVPPARILTGVVAGGRRVLRTGQVLTATPGGAVIGEVTSGIWSPTLERSIALAFVAREGAATGTPVFAELRGTVVQAELAELPFYRRPNTANPTPVNPTPATTGATS